MKTWRIASVTAAAGSVAAAVWFLTTPEAVSRKAGNADLVRTPPAVQALPADDLAGVCVLAPTGRESVRGTVVFRPHGSEVELSGTIEGLHPGRYRFEVTEYGDLRAPDSRSLGDLYFSQEVPAGRLPVEASSPLDLMAVEADRSGVVQLAHVNPALTLYGPESIIGRGFALYEAGLTGSEGRNRVAVGVIGRVNPDWLAVPSAPVTAHGAHAEGDC